MDRIYHHIPCPSYKGKLYLSGVNGLDYLDEMEVKYIVSMFPAFQNQKIGDGVEQDEIDIADRWDIGTLGKMNSTLDNVVGKILRSLRRGDNVLVHCFAGISRSTTVVLDFLIKHEPLVIDPKNPVTSALCYVKIFRKQANPNPGFLQLLEERNTKHLDTEDQTFTSNFDFTLL